MNNNGSFQQSDQAQILTLFKFWWKKKLFVRWAYFPIDFLTSPKVIVFRLRCVWQSQRVKKGKKFKSVEEHFLTFYMKRPLTKHIFGRCWSDTGLWCCIKMRWLSCRGELLSTTTKRWFQLPFYQECHNFSTNGSKHYGNFSMPIKSDEKSVPFCQLW